MSLRSNIVANIVGQVYVAAVGILVLPAYLAIMGAEAFGLVGIFGLLNAWFSLLDLGMVQIASRETARFHGGAREPLEFRRILRAFNLVFGGTAVVATGSLFLLAPIVANEWLKAEQLPVFEVQLAFNVMVVAALLRWASGLQRGIIVGTERQVSLSIFASASVTVRLLGVIPVLWWLGPTPTVFFSYQLVAAIVEFGVLAIFAHALMPRVNRPIGWSLRPLAPLAGQAFYIAGSAIAWFLIAQLDKLVLSGMLPLKEFGYFTLATMVASGIVTFTAPISNALLPNLTRLFAEGKHAVAIETYQRVTQLVAVLAGSAAITIAVCAEPLMLAWSGDPETARLTAPILAPYVAGAGIGALSFFAFYLTYALGAMRFHLLGSIVFAIALTPAVVVMAGRYGATGAAFAWLGVHATFFILWPALVHRVLVPGLHLTWLFKDVLAIIVPSAAGAVAVASLLPPPDGRWDGLLVVIATAVIAITISALSSSVCRSLIGAVLRRGSTLRVDHR